MDALGTPAPTSTPALPVPYLERIEVSFYDDEAAAAAAFADGEIDAVAGLPPATSRRLATDAGRRPRALPDDDALVGPAQPARRRTRSCATPRVRRALLAAIDRDALVADALGGDAIAADTLVPPSSWAFDAAAAAPVPYDPKAAAKLLNDAGWKKKDGKWTAKAARRRTGCSC